VTASFLFRYDIGTWPIRILVVLKQHGMYKEHLLWNMEREIVLLKRMIPLIEEKDLNYRPTEKVRSTFELMQYLSEIGSTMMHWYLVGMTPEFREKIGERRKTLTIANFAQRLDEQVANIHKYFESVSEEDLQNKIVEMPSKEKLALGAAIINGPIKWMATYRMELFVYLKICGKDHISTREAWVIDQPETVN
jgi:hypothetical protein